ncbi:MAG: hypothetical protein ACOY3P_00550 [Planctomycetota bacterium]
MSKRPWYQFTLAHLMLAAVLVNVLAAMLGGLMFRRRIPPEGIVALTVAAPLGTMLLVGVLHTVWRWWSNRTREKP